ncbi:ABC transporter permease subunit [Klebsiella spallanzanii]|uniref:Inner membrane ABC transporter permease protein YnjC n=1 Tax=Klebsiella spallanzanii TaxID=2587528 RepID=A0A564HA87_9ENTR|nr:ABC transporter permease subunit [Klebsiella spallanzanii]VUS28953.1 Inner membrane ABC transporter permease protein YnjC [Klebsiella spallanzanii]
MAAPLRYALTLLTWGLVALIYLPLLPAASLMALPALRLSCWQALFADPQFTQALTATLVSTLLSVGGAMLITATVVAALWPSTGWQRLVRRLPLLLAVPHVAFATAALLLFAEGGWLYRLLPFLSPAVDRYGIGLGLTMAVKESGFLLWVVYGLLGEKRLAGQATVLKSLGYGRWQCLKWLVLPALLPALSIVLLATTAWSLSAVDVALVIGPGNPPTLAVLTWQWLNQGDELQQNKGALASLVLLLILVMMALAAWGIWRAWRRRIPRVQGIRHPQPQALAGKSFAILLPLCGVACALLLAALAQSSPPVSESVGNSLWLGLCSAFIGAVICLLWLELGPSRFGGGIWLPLILPALPLADGQYQLALYAWLDGEWITVLWGHLLWVLPWMLFILQPAWRGRDPRAMLVARTLGWQQGRIFWRVTLPSLTRPLLTALAVGFSVSIAQYLPTLWLGGGRIPTLTSEAVALSSGGDTQILAAQALWQLLLPAVFFAFTALLAWLTGRYRQGLR